MSDKALKATEVFFDTVNGGSAAVMGFKMTRPVRQAIEDDSKVVSFYFDNEQLEWLIVQMARYVQANASSRMIWTPGAQLHKHVARG